MLSVFFRSLFPKFCAERVSSYLWRLQVKWYIFHFIIKIYLFITLIFLINTALSFVLILKEKQLCLPSLPFPTIQAQYKLLIIKHAAKIKEYQKYVWYYVQILDFKKGLFHQLLAIAMWKR